MAILKSGSSWYAGSVGKDTITEVYFVNSQSEVPAGWIESWNADNGDTGTIKGYLNGTVVYVAGDGSGSIEANADSSLMFCDFSTLTKIDGLALLDTSHTTNMSGMFRMAISLTTLDVRHFNTANVEDMSGMFMMLRSLTELDVNELVTNKVTNMSYMFSECSSLTSLDLINFDTSSVVTMASMFSSCTNLEHLNVLSFDTSNVTDMSYMFQSCAVTTLDLTSFSSDSLTYAYAMFSYCNNLSTIFVSDKWTTFTAVNDGGEYLFASCTNLIGGNGTEYIDNYANDAYDAIYARIDTPDALGYFTYKKYYPPAIRGDYIIQGETLYDLADKIRVLNGSEDAITPSEMQITLETHNTKMTEVLTAQDNLIAQISTVLESKSVPSLPKLTNPASADIIPSGYEAIDSNENVITGTGANLGDATAADVASGKTFTSVNGLKLVGTLVQKDFVTGSVNRSSTSTLTIPNLSNYKNCIAWAEHGSTDNIAFYPIFITKTNGGSVMARIPNMSGSSILLTANLPTVTTNKLTLSSKYTFYNKYSYVLWN